jgi:hypothetical protein
MVQNQNYELSCGVIIIVQKDPKEPRPFELFLRLDLGNGPGVIFEPVGHPLF